MCVCVLGSICITFFLLRDLFSTCFASFYYLVIRSILFHYIHAFIWISCAPLIIVMFLEWSFLVSCTLCQSWQKGGEIVEILVVFFFKILHVRGRNTCLCKGECLPPSSCTLHLVTMFTYIVLIFDDVCLLHLPLHVLFLFYLYAHASYTCMQSIIFVSEIQVVKVYLP